MAAALASRFSRAATAKDIHSNGDGSQSRRQFRCEESNVYPSSKGKKGAQLGDTIVASLKEAMANGKVKKGAVVYGMVVRAVMQRGRVDGSEVRFDDNAVVLVDSKDKNTKTDRRPIGTRVFGSVPHDLRKKKHLKILALGQHIA